MNPVYARLVPAPTRNAAAVWRAARRLAAWRPVVSAETLLVLASLAFTTFYNHAFWHLLFG